MIATEFDRETTLLASLIGVAVQPHASLDIVLVEIDR